MSKERIDYETENRESVRLNIAANGWQVLHENTTDHDPVLLAQGVERLTNCYFIVETEPSVRALEQIIAEQDLLILELTYQNIILEEGLA